MAVGQLDIKVAADIASFTTAMNGVQSSLKGIESSVKAISAIQIGEFGIGLLKGALEAVGQAFKAALDQAQRFQDVAGRLGGAEGLATAVQSIGLAMADLGVSFADTEAGLDKLGKGIVDFSANKTTKAAQAVKLLSTEFQGMVTSGAPLQQTMGQLVQELSQMAPSAERTFIAMNLLGKAMAGELLNGLTMTREEFARLAQENLAAAASWQGLANTVEQFENQMSALATRAFAPLADVMNVVVQSLSLLGPAFNELGSSLVEVGNLILDATNALFGIQSGFDVAVAAAGVFIGAVNAVISALASFISACVAAARAAQAAMGAIVAVGRMLNADLLTPSGRGEIVTQWENFKKGVTDVGDELQKVDKLSSQAGEKMDEAFKKGVEGTRRYAEQLKKTNAEQARLAKGAAAAGGAFTPPKAAKGGGGGKKKKGGGGGGKSDEERSVETLQKFIDKTRESMGTTESFTKAYEENMKKVAEATKKGLILPEEAAKMEAFFAKEREIKIAKATGISNMASILDDLQKGFESFGKTAADSLADAIVEGEDLSDVLKKLVKDLAKMILKVAILEPLMNSIFGKSGIGGLFGGAGGLFSSGVQSVPLQASMPAVPTGFSAFSRAAMPAVPMTNYGIARPRVSASATEAARTPVVNQNIGDMTINMTGTPAVTATSQQGRELGVKIRQSVQQILVEEQRAGGILASGGRR